MESYFLGGLGKYLIELGLFLVDVLLHGVFEGAEGVFVVFFVGDEILMDDFDDFVHLLEFDLIEEVEFVLEVVAQIDFQEIEVA